MVRRKVEIKAIDDKSKRHTTFSKRRNGLFKKIQEYCSKCDAQAAVIAFSKAGNVFAFGHPSVDILVSRYFADPSCALGREEDSSGVDERLRDNGGIMEEPPLTDAEKRIAEAMGNGKWNVAVENLGLLELDELSAEIEKIKCMVAARVTEVEARGKNILEGGFSGVDSTSGSSSS